jgi:hypothetical protein
VRLASRPPGRHPRGAAKPEATPIPREAIPSLEAAREGSTRRRHSGALEANATRRATAFAAPRGSEPRHRALRADAARRTRRGATGHEARRLERQASRESLEH